MSPDPATSKAEIRQLVWRIMETRRVARFPGCTGRIPNFVGAERAAVHLQALRRWRAARTVAINPDPPQLAVRRMALRDGKIVYVAVPPLRSPDCFLELDPDRLGRRAPQAASARGAERLGRPVRLDAMPPIDLVVCGAVAVNGRGARIGMGGGFSDLEYALLREAGKVGGGTPIVTTVHAVQVLPQEIEMLVHDIPVDVVVTPEGLMRLTTPYARPRGIYREALSPARVAEMPLLQRLRDRRA